MNPLQTEHPNFQGNWEDLRQLLLLANSPIRSTERGEALDAWSAYKKQRQIAAMQAENPNERVLTKGGYIRSLSKKTIDLRGANLDEVMLGYADLRAVILDGASMRGAWMKGVQLQDASLKGVDFGRSEYGRDTRMMEGNFNYADLSGAQLQEADLSDSTFKQTNLSGADLSGSNLSNTVFTKSNLTNTILTQSRIYGISAWDLMKEGAQQDNLLIESAGDLISVDDLEIAQFVYLMLHNKNITNVISTIGWKAVLDPGALYAGTKSCTGCHSG